MFTLLQKTKLKTVQLNVSKDYCGSESYAVLDDLNIDVRDGEFVNMEHCRNGD
jgi:ABC-type nitrate/sulfonate/bicarbonate transport system ATPase subunit